MHTLTSLPVLAVFLTPLPLLAPFFVPCTVANRDGSLTGRRVRLLAVLSMILGVISVIVLGCSGSPVEGKLFGIGAFYLAVYFDAVSAIMLLLVAFLGVAVTSFSLNYLGGNPDQGRFFKWLSITLGSVLLLIVSGNLALFTLCWMAISLSLHQLLTFYPDRPAALMAARKKYLFSRLGDLCLLTALVIAWREFGSLDYARLFAIASQGSTPALQGIALLLVLAAMIKSAQFPFHGWLPDTMETPTPVSALMHAGIINAGGFLIVRFSPLVSLSPGALELLAAVGGFTALFGSLVMITQTSVKRTLGFSTIAQMGFMMLQCGLGAFALALLHIVAHSLYKAHTFFSSGSAVRHAITTGQPPRKRYLGLAGALAAFLVAAALVTTTGFFSGSWHWSDSGWTGLSLILTIAVAQLLWSWWGTAPSWRGVVLGILAGGGISALCCLLHEGVGSLLGATVASPPRFTLAWPIAIITVAAFLLLALRVFLPPTWVSTRLGQAIFVHAYNGFYVNTLANRLLCRISPNTRKHP